MPCHLPLVVQEILECAMKLGAVVGTLAEALEMQQTRFEQKTQELTALVRDTLRHTFIPS